MPAKRSNKKSRNWAAKHVSDAYVKQAQTKGYRARSAFKLEEIDKKYRLIRAHSRIIDLGASPGSWTQYVTKQVKSGSTIISVDLLPMSPMENVLFVQGDFTESGTRDRISELVDNEKFDLVLSDMAPNITGIRITDQANIESLQLSIMEFCNHSLNRNGVLLTKFFEGELARKIRLDYQKFFNQVQIIKPDASRSQSSEIYLLGRHFLGNVSN